MISKNTDDVDAQARTTKYVMLAVVATLFIATLACIGTHRRPKPRPPAPEPAAEKPAHNADEHSLRLLALHNEARAAERLEPLRLDGALELLAMTRCLSRSGSTGGKVAGGDDTNETDSYSSADNAFGSWVIDPAARAKILDPKWRTMGVGLRRDDGGVAQWVVKYGARPER